MGGHCLSGFSSTLFNQVHACMVCNPSEFSCLCYSTFQCTENATAYISWSGDECYFCKVKEFNAIDAFA